MNARLWLVLALPVLLCGTLPVPASGDWVNLSGAQNAPNIAEIYINDDHIKVNLEIFVGDLLTFERLLPDEFFKNTGIRRLPLASRLRQFSDEDFQIKTDDGQRLQARLTMIEPRLRQDRASPFPWKVNPYTGRPIPGPPEDPRVLYAELVYPFRKRPESLTLVPPLDDKGTARVPIGFTAYHRRVPVVDFRYLSGPSTVTLDWADPWYSEFESKALRRWQTAGVMSFLYIEPYEVRHEILARVKDLAAWIDLGLRGPDFVEADENDPLKQRVGQFFLERERVWIDGQRRRPILDRTALVKFSTTASTFLEQPERLAIETAMVGVIITYLTEGLPQEVRSEWTLWSDRIRRVPTDAIDPAGGLPSVVTPADNVHVWRNFLKRYTIPTVERVAVADSVKGLRVPIGSVVCLAMILPVAWQIRTRRGRGRPVGMQAGLAVLLAAGAALLYPYLGVSVPRPGSAASRVSQEEARLMLHSLLRNVYRAFDFREEADVYDKLALSVSGDLLTDLYLRNRRSFEVKQAGGAQARVKEVAVLDAEVAGSARSSGALDLRSRWTALGTVGHWGHVHTRQNQYEARVTVEPVGGAWKIVGLELLEEKRIDPSAQGADQKGPASAGPPAPRR